MTKTTTNAMPAARKIGRRRTFVLEVAVKSEPRRVVGLSGSTSSPMALDFAVVRSFFENHGFQSFSVSS